MCGEDPNVDVAFVQTSSDDTNDRVDDLLGSGHAKSAAYAINNDGHVVGWSRNTTLATTRVWLWRYDSEKEEWDEDGEQLTPLPSSYVKAEANDINDADPFEIIGNYNYPDIEGGFYTLEYSSTWESINLDGHTMLPWYHIKGVLDPQSKGAPDPVVDRCFGINDDGWIAGSYQPIQDETPVSYRPCVLIQHDVDNDGDPDAREIFTDADDDENENWLLDWAENDTANTEQYMRLGLHAPGYNGTGSGTDPTYTQGIDHVQIVRLGSVLGQFTGVASELPELVVIEDVVDPEDDETCANLVTNIDNWGQGVSPTNDQREIVLYVCSVHNDYDQRDTLPPTDSDRATDLANIRKFAYRFAHCIDYLQFGNEVFGGAGGYVVRDDELACLGSDTAIENITGTCFDDAIALILEWLGYQTEAARMASALAGRPLRFFGPGVQDGHLTVGSDPDADADGPFTNDENRAAHIVRETSQYVNKHRMIFDSHIYYLSVSDDTNTEDVFTKHVDRLTATGDFTGVEWANDVPMMRGTLELGPHPATDLTEPNPLDDWMDDNEQFIALYGTAGNQSQLEFDYWNDFQADWETNNGDEDGQFQGDGFELGDVFDDLEANGYIVVCYAATLQPATSLAGEWHMNALRAQHVNGDYFLAGNKVARFTYVRNEYETAASTRLIDENDFEPHPNTCDCVDVCDDCGS